MARGHHKQTPPPGNLFLIFLCATHTAVRTSREGSLVVMTLKGYKQGLLLGIVSVCERPSPSLTLASAVSSTQNDVSPSRFYNPTHS